LPNKLHLTHTDWHIASLGRKERGGGGGLVMGESTTLEKVECVQQPGDENTELGHMLKGGTNED
jgi:hypothetical protein